MATWWVFLWHIVHLTILKLLAFQTHMLKDIPHIRKLGHLALCWLVCGLWGCSSLVNAPVAGSANSSTRWQPELEFALPPGFVLARLWLTGLLFFGERTCCWQCKFQYPLAA